MHSRAQFRAILFDASILIAVECSPAEWEAKLRELGFCLVEGDWYRLGALAPSEFEYLSPAITLVGFDYSFLCGGQPISEAAPLSPILAHELRVLWRRNKEAVLLELDRHAVRTVWDAANCISAAIAGEGGEAALALRSLAARGLADRWHGSDLPPLTRVEQSQGHSFGAKLTALAGEALSQLTGLPSDNQTYLVEPAWRSDGHVWISREHEELESLPVGGLLKAADVSTRSSARLGTDRSLCDHADQAAHKANGELLNSLSSMHYGTIGVVLRYEYGRLGLFFEHDDGRHQALGIACEVNYADSSTALGLAADRLLEVVTRRGAAVRRLGAFLAPHGACTEGYLARSFKSYCSAAIMRSLRESGRGAILSDFEIDQLLAMLAAPAHSIASCAISIATGSECEFTVGWVEDATISSSSMRSYLRGEVDDLQPAASVVVHFSRSSSALVGEENEETQFYASLQQLIAGAGEHLRAGVFDCDQLSAGLWRLGRLATLPRAEKALYSIWSADQLDLQRWMLTEIASQLKGRPNLEELDIQALAQLAADAVRGYQGVLISVPIYGGAHELTRVQWAPCCLLRQRCVDLRGNVDARPAIRLQIDAFRYADPGYSEMLDELEIAHQGGADALTVQNWKYAAYQAQDDLILDRAYLWPRAERDNLVRSCAGLHRQLVLGVWHGLPSRPQSGDRLAIRAFRTLVVGMKMACESSRGSLQRGCRGRVERWLREAVEMVCADQVVNRYYSKYKVYCSSQPWVPRVSDAFGGRVPSLQLVAESTDAHNDRRRTVVLLSVISNELRHVCALHAIPLSTGLRAAAEIIGHSRIGEPIDWLWAWHACEKHLLERADWDLLVEVMDAALFSGVEATGLDVREWSAQSFATWARSSRVHANGVPTNFLSTRRFIERVHALLNLGTPAVIGMAIDRLRA